MLVNNAGHFSGGLFERGDLGEFYELIQINLSALVHLTYRLLPGMLARGHGKIVNNASIAGYAHFPGAAVYSASKSAVVGFSEALRRELEESPVSVLHLVTRESRRTCSSRCERTTSRTWSDTSKLDGVEPRGVGGEDRRRDRGRRRGAQPDRGRASRQAGLTRSGGRFSMPRSGGSSKR